jgi:Nas2 N_terminal domain
LFDPHEQVWGMRPDMGFTLPSPTSPAEQVRTLVARKEAIEAELDVHLAVLKDNAVTLRSPSLVDSEGFPRADIDVYAVRGARVRIIELRNDLKAVVDSIAKALEDVYNPTSAQHSTATSTSSAPEAKPGATQAVPFAKVDGVAPGSPAAEAVRSYILCHRQLLFWAKARLVGFTKRRSHCRIRTLDPAVVHLLVVDSLG